MENRPAKRQSGKNFRRALCIEAANLPEGVAVQPIERWFFFFIYNAIATMLLLPIDVILATFVGQPMQTVISMLNPKDIGQGPSGVTVPSRATKP